MAWAAVVSTIAARNTPMSAVAAHIQMRSYSSTCIGVVSVMRRAAAHERDVGRKPSEREEQAEDEDDRERAAGMADVLQGIGRGLGRLGGCSHLRLRECCAALC